MSNRNPQIIENLEKAKQLFKNTIKICHRTKKTTKHTQHMCWVCLVFFGTSIIVHDKTNEVNAISLERRRDR